MFDSWAIPGETLQSALIQDIPWTMPDHFIFFGALYAVLGCIMGGVGIVMIKSLMDAQKGHGHH